jgi:hypothetical protein
VSTHHATPRAEKTDRKRERERERERESKEEKEAGKRRTMPLG